jgi:hypothetical protein
MAINKNHEFEELNGVKCAIVEKNVSPERAEFLKKLLEYNHYTVVIVPTPAPKVAVPPVIKTEDGSVLPPPPVPPAPPQPETFTVGVTDSTFNAINAIFGRLLKTAGGHIVTQAYWLQKDSVSDDEVPYYEKKL